MSRQRFKDSQMQAAYAYAVEQGVPRAGASIYCAYLGGLGVRGCPPAPRNSLAYAWWRAGRDNLEAGRLGARDAATLASLRLPNPFTDSAA